MSKISDDTRATLGDVVRHEFRLLAAQRLLWAISAVFIVLAASGLYLGLIRVEARNSTLKALQEEQSKRLDRLVKQVNAIYAGSEKPDLYLRPDSPSWAGGSLGARYAYPPNTPLAPLALGQLDLQSDYFRVSSYDKTTFIFNDPIQNPWHLIDGHFDLAFVVVYLLPLLIIAVSYNLLSAEREEGTLKLLLSQPLALSTLVFGKVAARGLLLLGLAVIVPLGGFLLFAAPGTAALVELALWIAVVFTYGLFWFALCILVNSWGKTSAANAVILCSVWVVLVFIVPVLLNVFVTRLHPVPSRVEMITKVRDVITDARARYAGMDTEDYHPELVPVKEGKVFIQGYQKRSWLTQKELIPQTDAILGNFDRQLERQQSMVDRYRFLSPAVVIYEAITDLAGTGVKRYRHFLRQVDAFHRKQEEFFFPRVFSETRLTAADYDLMPRYEWREEVAGDVRRRALIGWLGLLIPTLIVLILGLRRLKSHSNALGAE